ncbi:hypothetical protein DUI87_35089 [Hirundo rustica rustica]|uniref:Uncharacterized protein n=1 Tax=Hirundo rustica rustica TaxID=333673 RepID=A0A3M0IJL2_HIRRU|nr:hypothetical protein DUI87_35089 [Hirundo rustica rustica]
MPRLPLVAGRSCLLTLQPLLVSRHGDCSRCSSSFPTSVDRRWCYVCQRGILHTKPLQHYTLFGYVRYCRNENISCEHQKDPNPTLFPVVDHVGMVTICRKTTGDKPHPMMINKSQLYLD